MEVIIHMKNCAQYNGQVSKFTFDMRPESDHNAGILYGALANEPDWRQFLVDEISFVTSRTNPRVQVADLFARETMKALGNIVGPVTRPPRKSWLALHGTERFHIAAFGEEYFADLKRQMPELERHSGVSRDAYLQWLRAKNRQHSMTNLLLYMSTA